MSPRIRSLVDANANADANADDDDNADDAVEPALDAWLDHLVLCFVTKGTPREVFERHVRQDQRAGVFDAAGIQVVEVAAAEEHEGAPRRTIVVSTARVFLRAIYVRGRVVRVGGVGEVCTHPHHRSKGYSTLALNRALAYMRDRSIGVSSLHTSNVASFYRSLGWISVPRIYAVVDVQRDPLFAANAALTSPHRFTVHPIDPTFGSAAAADSTTTTTTRRLIRTLARLYNSFAPRFDGTCVRTERYWREWVGGEHAAIQRAAAASSVSSTDGDSSSAAPARPPRRVSPVLAFVAVRDDAAKSTTELDDDDARDDDADELYPRASAYLFIQLESPLPNAATSHPSTWWNVREFACDDVEFARDGGASAFRALLDHARVDVDAPPHWLKCPLPTLATFASHRSDGGGDAYMPESSVVDDGFMYRRVATSAGDVSAVDEPFAPLAADVDGAWPKAVDGERVDKDDDDDGVPSLLSASASTHLFFAVDSF